MLSLAVDPELYLQFGSFFFFNLLSKVEEIQEDEGGMKRLQGDDEMLALCTKFLRK